MLFLDTVTILILGFLLVMIGFIIAFLKLEYFRKYRIRFKILYNQGRLYFKHFYYMVKFIVRLTEFIKTFIIIGVFIGILFLLALYIIQLYNTYLVPMYHLKEIKIDFSRYSPLFAIGWLGGMLLSVFLKPKLERFADRVNAKPQMIYIFGSNDMTRKLVYSLIELGLGPMTALISEKSLYWIEALGAQLDLLILDNPEELKTETLYDKITFKNALKVVILVEDTELSQHILVNVRRVNPNASIILLSQYKPPIIDLVGQYTPNIHIINDIETISNEIIRRLALGFDYAPVIEAFVPEDYVNRPIHAIEEDFNNKVKVLGVKRQGEIVIADKFKKGDKVILYLVDRKALREFLVLIPKVSEEEHLGEEKVEVEDKEAPGDEVSIEGASGEATVVKEKSGSLLDKIKSKEKQD